MVNSLGLSVRPDFLEIIVPLGYCLLNFHASKRANVIEDFYEAPVRFLNEESQSASCRSTKYAIAVLDQDSSLSRRGQSQLASSQAGNESLIAALCKFA